MNTLKPYQKKVLTTIYTHLNVPITNKGTLDNMNKIYLYLIDSEYATSTKRDYLIIFALLLRNLGQFDAGDVVYKKAKEYNEQYTRKELRQELDENEQKNYIPFGDLLKKVNDLVSIYNNERSYKNIINVLILALYVLHPPIRNDYNDMKVIRSFKDNDGKRNYFMIDTSDKELPAPLFYVIINKDKVSKTAGSLEIQINDPLLINILKVYFEQYAHDHKYLFETNKGKPYTKRQIQYVINNYFDNKTLNIYNLRSAYISAFYKHNHDLQSRNELARKMRHSKDTAELIYCKFF